MSEKPSFSKLWKENQNTRYLIILIINTILFFAVYKICLYYGELTQQTFYSFLVMVIYMALFVIFLMAYLIYNRFLYRKKTDVEIDLLATPSIEMNDESGNKAFSSVTADSMFQATYAGTDGKTPVVISSDGKSVIAPGTSGEYVFELENTGDVPLVYSVTLDGFFSVENSDSILPICVRMKGQEGDYLIGSDTSWEPLAKLNNISDAGTLKERTSRYYTIEWMWSFDGSNDILDTILGNGTLDEGTHGTLEHDENLDFTLQIETFAMMPVEDRTPMTLFFDCAFPILLVVSLVLLIGTLVAVFKYRRTHKDSKI
jgi:hypothetical protein